MYPRDEAVLSPEQFLEEVIKEMRSTPRSRAFTLRLATEGEEKVQGRLRALTAARNFKISFGETKGEDVRYVVVTFFDKDAAA